MLKRTVYFYLILIVISSSPSFASGGGLPRPTTPTESPVQISQAEANWFRGMVLRSSSDQPSSEVRAFGSLLKAGTLSSRNTQRAIERIRSINPATAQNFLMNAADQGFEGLAELLLRAGVHPSQDGAASSLRWAAIHGRTNTVRLLLRHGADPNVAYCQKTPLEDLISSTLTNAAPSIYDHSTALNNWTEIANILHDHNSQLSNKDELLMSVARRFFHALVIPAWLNNSMPSMIGTQLFTYHDVMVWLVSRGANPDGVFQMFEQSVDSEVINIDGRRYAVSLQFKNQLMGVLAALRNQMHLARPVQH